MSASKASDRIAGIEVLRAVAALLVTVCHAQYELSRIGELPAAMPTVVLQGLTGFGVQLFFVVSGFVMVYATEPLFGSRYGPLVFLERRVVRIVPLYWIVSTIYLAITLLIPMFDKGYPAEFVIKSYLFIPAARPDGVIEPLVGQGWSLNYEMLFYLVFALTVFSSRRASAVVVTAILVSAVAIGQMAHPLPLVFAVWTSPLLLFFVCGMWIGLAYREGFRLTPVQGLALIGLGTALLFIHLYRPVASLDLGLAVWFIPALIVAGATLPRLSFAGPVWSLVITIGTASYALYLFHAIPIRAFFYLARWSGIDLGRASVAYVCAAVVISTLSAVAIYNAIERPLIRALRRRGPAESLLTPVGAVDQPSIAMAQPQLQARGVEAIHANASARVP